MKISMNFMKKVRNPKTAFFFISEFPYIFRSKNVTPIIVYFNSSSFFCFQILPSDTHLMRHKIITVLGATGTGKTDLGIAIAKKFNGEVINADVMQIYKGLPIITNKATPEEQSVVKHHLLDVHDNSPEKKPYGLVLRKCGP